MKHTRKMRIDNQPIETFEYDNWYNDIITLFNERKCNNVMFFTDDNDACAYVYTDAQDNIYWWSIVHTSAKKTNRQMQLVEIITHVPDAEIEALGVKYVDNITFSTEEVQLDEFMLEVQSIMRKAQAQARADRYAKGVMRKYK